MDLPCFEARRVPGQDMPRCALGEAATWSPQRRALLWTDIAERQLWSYEPARQRLRHWALPQRLGSFALTPDRHRLLAAFEHQLAWLDLRTGRCQTLVEVQPEAPVRANDGRCDRQGRFVFGTLDEARGPQALGRWWRFGAPGLLEPLDLPPVSIPNGLAFSPDGRRLYFCDSSEQRLRCAGYGGQPEHLGAPQVFAPVPQGEPDGATVDAQGHYWCAIWGAGEVLGFGSDGRPMARVTLPVSQPSCVAFGGADLRTLYITTARVGLSAQQLAREPDAGMLHAARLPWAGLPEPLYGWP